MIRDKKGPSRLVRFGICCILPIATGAASWVDPPPAADVPTGTPQASRIQAGAGSPVTITLGNQDDATSRASGPESGLEVMQWRFTDRLADAPSQPSEATMVSGRPLYLWMVLDGTQTAVDGLRADHGLTIQVHWLRDARETGTGAPNLTTELAIGQPGLADTFEQQVHRQGSFKWHSWARKDALSPGTWTVSLTYEDGKPLACVPDAKPCQFTIRAG
ncbi:MAG: hypothetical protein WA633_01725 [Stellaceae bacterium]